MSCFFRTWPCQRFVVALAIIASGSFATAKSPQVAADLPVDVFAAQQAGDLEVGVVPQNERRVTIQLKNKAERPLTIQLPPAFAAVPILAQQPGLFPGFPNPNQNARNQQQAPQQLGLGFNGGNQQGQGQGQGNLFGGIFNIPAGKAIKIKAEAVCLEYGKPNPDARMKYELKPLASVCDKPELAVVLTSLGKDEIDQRVAQAAAWHLTDNLSYDKLVGLLRREVGATKEYQFTRDQVASAKSFLEKSGQQRSPNSTASETNASPPTAGKPFSVLAGGAVQGFQQK